MQNQWLTPKFDGTQPLATMDYEGLRGLVTARAIPADLLNSARYSALWALVRELSNGRGWVTVSMDLLEKLLKRTRRTIQKWIKLCVRDGWFRHVKKLDDGIYQIFHASLIKVSKLVGLRKLGACAKICFTRFADSKRTATDIAVQVFQEQARWNQLQNAPRGADSASVLTVIDSALEISAREELSRYKLRGIQIRDVSSNDLIFVDRGTDLMFSVSQKGIGKILGMSQQGVSSRLKNTPVRLKRDVPITRAFRVATAIRDHRNRMVRTTKAAHKCKIEMAYKAGDYELASKLESQFVSEGFLWQSQASLYVPHGIEIQSSKRLKSRYKQFLTRSA